MSRPTITTLCGSTRFPEAFALANMHLSLEGRIVIGLGLMGHADEPRGARHLTSDGDETTPIKQGLDTLHFAKIDLADGIYVVNVGGYVGSSTRREIQHARSTGKAVEWMFPSAVPVDLRDERPTGRLTVAQRKMLAALAADERGEGHVSPGTVRARTAQSLADRGLLTGDLVSRSGGWIRLTAAGRAAAPTSEGVCRSTTQEGGADAC